MRAGCAIALALAVLGCTGTTCPAGTRLAEARRDTVLSWDDGQYQSDSDAFASVPGVRLAVRYVAPEWVQSVVGVSYYIMPFSGTWPEPGPPNTILSFSGCMWRPDSVDPSMPGGPACFSLDSGSGHPVDGWLTLTFPEPVSVADPAAFPGGVFFVGLEWKYRVDPCIGLDYSAPIDGMTRWYDLSQWVPVPDADAMIRAIVSDTPGTGVAESSWARIKALYRRARA
jgi:hypothetical protein